LPQVAEGTETIELSQEGFADRGLARDAGRGRVALSTAAAGTGRYGEILTLGDLPCEEKISTGGRQCLPATVVSKKAIFPDI
jgi:hypothetical protein